ncbi:hypothetical protein M378DRAFT_182526, partial [Amanita muscaria Koide BX008]
MDDPNPALRSDGTLKEASEMQWLHSPSDEQSTRSLDRPQSPSPRTPTSDQLLLASEAMPGSLTALRSSGGLADKDPAKKVGKRRIALSSRAREQSQEQSFFTRIAVSPGSREMVIGARKHAEGTTVTRANKRKLSAAADIDSSKKPKNGAQSIANHSSRTSSTASNSMTADSVTAFSTIRRNSAVGDDVEE